MSDTPRTDAMIQPVPGRDCVTGQPIDVVHADDARQLERELRAKDDDVVLRALLMATWSAPETRTAGEMRAAAVTLFGAAAVDAALRTLRHE